ncbi:MAG: hypothetical protein LBE12_09785 [Planctomycetaceae bacterium]|jgi:hypothetical protein|nr:hypothetical protein [Planctomycetaceae bacterium]
MTLIVKLCCNHTLNFLIFILFFGILSKNFADDQRSATVSKNSPNATTNAFSDLPQKTQNWTRYLSVSTGDDSVFKQVYTVGNDASSSWVLIDGYELRQLPYSFPQENRPGYIHYRGTNNPDAECKQYQPQFSGIAGFIGGSGTQNNDYAWTVTTNNSHTIYWATITASANGNLPAPVDGVIDLGTTITIPEHGHANWIVRIEPTTLQNDLYPHFGNKIYGFAGMVGLTDDEIVARGLKNFNAIANPIVYRRGILAFLGEQLKPKQHKFNITYEEFCNVLSCMKELETKSDNMTEIYNLFVFNCADACIRILQASGIAVNRNLFRKTVEGKFGISPFTVSFSEEMTIPQLLGDWLQSRL